MHVCIPKQDVAFLPFFLNFYKDTECFFLYLVSFHILSVKLIHVEHVAQVH